MGIHDDICEDADDDDDVVVVVVVQHGVSTSPLTNEVRGA